MSGWSGYSEQGTGSEERGPASFALNIPGVVQASAGPTGQAVAVQGGMRGETAGVTAKMRTSIPEYEDPTSALLMKMGEKFVGAKINRMRDEQFLTGVQQAASGKALVDIVNDQPWYGKIFGDVPMVEGARAYETSTRASKWASDQLIQMNKLRELSPDALPKAVLASTDKLLTGDVAGDMQFQAEVLKRLPGLIEQHTKEHYKWGQEKLRKGAADNIAAVSLETQQVLSNPDPAISSPETRKGAVSRVFEAFTPPVGMDDDAAEKMILDGTLSAAEAGNWHAVGILQESGVFKQLDPGKRTALQNSIRAYADRHRTQSADALPFNVRAAVLRERAQNDPTYSANQYIAEAQQLNSEFSKQTGNPAPLVSNLEQAHGASTAIQAVYNMIRASQRAAGSKSTDKVEKGNMLTQDAIQGRLGLVVHDPDVSRSEADTAFVTAFNAMKELDPANYSERQTRMVISNAVNGGYVNPRLKAEWTSSLNALGDEPTAAFNNTYTKWQELKKHKDSAAAREGYFGAEMDSRLERYHSLMSGTPEAVISNYRAAMLQPVKRATLDKQDKADIGAFLDDQVGRHFWIGKPKELGSSIPERTRKTLIDAMETEFATYKGMSPELGNEEISKRSFAAVKRKGIEVLGGHAVRGVAGQTSISTVTGMDPEAVDEAFTAMIEQHAPDLAGEITLMRLSGTAKRAEFEGTYRDDKQRSQRVYFTSDDLRQYETDRRLGKQKPRKLSFGPEITFPPPGARSPYNRNQR